MTETQVKPLKQMLDILSAVTDELVMSKRDDGWTVMAVDKSHTTMVRIRTPLLPVTDEPWAVRIDDIRKGLKGDTVDISLDTSLMVAAGNTRTRMPLLTPEIPNQRFPSLSGDASATILADDFKAILKDADAKKVNHVILTISEDGVVLDATDDQGYGQTLRIPPEECLDIDASTPAKSRYSLDLLGGFIKNLPTGAEIRLSESTDYPLMISLSQSGFDAEWVCAPVIVTED